MCKCNPSIKTPFCGKGDCQEPSLNLNNGLNAESVIRRFISDTELMISVLPPSSLIEEITISSLQRLLKEVLLSKDFILRTEHRKKDNAVEVKWSYKPFREKQILENQIELLKEELECVNTYLSNLKAPIEEEGKKLSVVGRVKVLREQDRLLSVARENDIIQHISSLGN